MMIVSCLAGTNLGLLWLGYGIKIFFLVLGADFCVHLVAVNIR